MANVVAEQPQQQIVTVNANEQQLTCMNIFLDCKAPKLAKQQQVCGIVNVICPGAGVGLGGLCCDVQNAKVLNMCLSGCSMCVTAPFVVGCVSSIIVGLKMAGVEFK